ncbi:hypothetical protein TrRE_jg9992 [Triparma retinervis]|uniref:ATP synthase mitochondrial F1 complex assembly factor 2 n=1 Tax=Triparma retinervis TaxID=2557542 RepID=A0A9W7AEI0_9STRA|nr:hypothetical protein TrRE_jg9992 [Triparma retinervis]
MRGGDIGISTTKRSINSDRVSEVRSAVHSKMQGRKRFYESVTVANIKDVSGMEDARVAVSSGVDGGSGGVRLGGGSISPDAYREWYTVLLDGRKLSTPAKNSLLIPSRGLAEAIRNEWDYQDGFVEPSSMPFTSLCYTAIDQVEGEKGWTRDSIMRYLRNDTLCYPEGGGEEGKVIRRMQEERWGKVLAWAESEAGLGAKPHMETGISGMGGLKHPDSLTERATDRLEGMDAWSLAAMQSLTREGKSFLLALALMEDVVTVEEACEAGRVEEDFNIEQWGLVEGGHDFDILNNRIGVRAGWMYKEWIREGRK